MSTFYRQIFSSGSHTVRSSDPSDIPMLNGSNLALDTALPFTVDNAFVDPNVTATQLFLKFDTTAVSGSPPFADLLLPLNGSSANYHLDAYRFDWTTQQTANWRTNAQFGGMTVWKNDFVVQSGDYTHAAEVVSPSIPAQSNYGILVAQNNLTAGGTYISGEAIVDAEPSLLVAQAGYWDSVGVSAGVGSTSTTLTLAEPANVAQGDLLVACISYRALSTVDVTLPAGWTRGPQQKNSNDDDGLTTSIGSGVMAWIIRGASAPDLSFTVPTDGTNVSYGTILAYRGAHQLAPLVASDGATNLGTASEAMDAPAITTPVHDTLLVYMTIGARDSSVNTVYAEAMPDYVIGQGTASSVSTTADPSPVRWEERFDNKNTSGSRCSLGVANVILLNPGTVGPFHATYGNIAHHGGLIAAFRLAVEILAAANVAVAAPVLGAPTLELAVADLTASNILVPAPAVASAAMDQAQLLDLWLNDRVVQYGMDVFADVDTIAILSDAPKNWWQAYTGYKLGTKSVGFGDITFDADGGKVATAAITQGTVNAAGQGKVWAALDTLQSRIIAYGNLSAPVAVTMDKHWSLDPVEIVMPRSPA